VLYEMLTGECPFRRATITDTLAAVVERRAGFHEAARETALPDPALPE